MATARLSPCLRVVPEAGVTRASLEDDLHAMSVTLRHDDVRVTGIVGIMHRAPWTPCEGAEAVLAATFAGIALADVTVRRDRTLNCTHLHDLALLAAAHAHDRSPIDYRIAVSDPDDGVRLLEIARDGLSIHRWQERDGIFVAPAAIAGRSALNLRDWIGTLAGHEQEAARLLQWSALVAHGRTMTDEERRSALGHRASCHTMQPERAGRARQRSGLVDFSRSGRELLAQINTAVVQDSADYPAPRTRMGEA